MTSEEHDWSRIHADSVRIESRPDGYTVIVRERLPLTEQYAIAEIPCWSGPRAIQLVRAIRR